MSPGRPGQSASAAAGMRRRVAPPEGLEPSPTGRGVTNKTGVLCLSSRTMWRRLTRTPTPTHRSRRVSYDGYLVRCGYSIPLSCLMERSSPHRRIDNKTCTRCLLEWFWDAVNRSDQGKRGLEPLSVFETDSLPRSIPILRIGISCGRGESNSLLRRGGPACCPLTPRPRMSIREPSVRSSNPALEASYFGARRTPRISHRIDRSRLKTRTPTSWSRARRATDYTSRDHERRVDDSNVRGRQPSHGLATRRITSLPTLRSLAPPPRLELGLNCF